MNSSTKLLLSSFATGLVFYATIGIDSVFFRGQNYIPRENEASQGYAIPNKIGIKLEDVDADGKEETIFKYAEKSYLLRVDEQNKPYILEYEVKPAEIISRIKETQILEKEK
ncbi:MAG: hypothetical protein AABX83_02470 [Nanoarchaeota archaeon]